MRATGPSKRKTDALARDLFEAVTETTRSLANNAAPMIAKLPADQRSSVVSKMREELQASIRDRMTGDLIGADAVSSLADRAFMKHLSDAVRSLNTLKAPPK